MLIAGERNEVNEEEVGDIVHAMRSRRGDAEPASSAMAKAGKTVAQHLARALFEPRHLLIHINGFHAFGQPLEYQMFGFEIGDGSLEIEAIVHSFADRDE